MTETNPNEQQVFVVEKKQLPLSCPLPENEVWALHPRVFLPMENKKETKCPYCGTTYILKTD